MSEPPETADGFLGPSSEKVLKLVIPAGDLGILKDVGIAVKPVVGVKSMERTIRLVTVLTLVVAFLVTGLLPAAGSWSCPDGTACVYTAGRGFHCLTEQWQMACCAAQTASRGCGRCDHGAVASVASGARSHQHAVGEPTHCRYHEPQQVEPAPVTIAGASDFQAHTLAVLLAPAVVPVAPSVSTQLSAVRGSRSPSHPTPPSSPRAPPGLDCA